MSVLHGHGETPDCDDAGFDCPCGAAAIKVWDSVKHYSDVTYVCTEGHTEEEMDAIEREREKEKEDEEKEEEA